MMTRTVLVVLALALVAQAKPTRNYYGGMFDHPFFRTPADYDDSAVSDESVSAPDSAEIPQIPVGGPFSSLGSMLDGIFHRMRQQIEHIPNFRVPQVPSIGSIGVPAFGIPNSPSNSSSTTTIVGDHVVTVNETVYHKDNGGVKSVFRIKVIDVSPSKKTPAAEKVPEAEKEDVEEEGGDEEIVEVDMPAEKTEASATVAQEVEAEDTPTAASVEETDELDNEIPNKEGETLLEAVRRWNQMERAKVAAERHPDDDVEVLARDEPIDLSGDLRVNQILREQADKGGLFMADPDAEFVEVDEEGKLIPDMQAV